MYGARDVLGVQLGFGVYKFGKAGFEAVRDSGGDVVRP